MERLLEPRRVKLHPGEQKSGRLKPYRNFLSFFFFIPNEIDSLRFRFFPRSSSSSFFFLFCFIRGKEEPARMNRWFGSRDSSDASKSRANLRDPLALSLKAALRAARRPPRGAGEA